MENLLTNGLAKFPERGKGGAEKGLGGAHGQS